MPHFFRYDHNVIRMKEFYCKYLHTHIVNNLNSQMRIENMVVKASVFCISF